MWARQQHGSLPPLRGTHAIHAPPPAGRHSTGGNSCTHRFLLVPRSSRSPDVQGHHPGFRPVGARSRRRNGARLALRVLHPDELEWGRDLLRPWDQTTRRRHHPERSGQLFRGARRARPWVMPSPYSSFSENGLAVKDGVQRTHQSRGTPESELQTSRSEAIWPATPSAPSAL